jgi:hypothetical protein
MAVSQTELGKLFSFSVITIIIIVKFKIYFDTLYRSRMLLLIGEYKISEMRT